jgi:predicted RNase H-like HicB family nuclease
MKKELTFIIEESPEGGFSARALGESINTEADSEEQLKQNIKEAVTCHFEEEEMPFIIRLHFVRDEYINT